MDLSGFNNKAENMKEDKRITTSVSHECWKSLKVLAVQKEVNLQKVVTEVLENYINKLNSKISKE